MRIAIFSEVYWPMVSGVSVTLQRTAAALAARGHAVRVYAPHYPLPDGAADTDEVHRSPAGTFFLYPDVQWAFPQHGDLVADLATFRPDVVHVATEFAMGISGVRAAARLGVPVIASAHTDYERYASRYRLDWLRRTGWHYLRWFYGQARRVLCPSQVYRDHLRSRGVPHAGIWSRGVDLTQFSPSHRSDAWRASVGAGPDDPLLLYVGRLAAEKNLPVLLDAWRRLGEARGAAKLVLVGGGPLEEGLRKQAPEGVHLTGVLRGEALATAYASADGFAFPSSTETFGNVLLEAMASGLPCVAARAGGVLDFAEHDRNAWLVSPDDARAFASGLAVLLGEKGRAARLAARALDTARRRDWNAVFDDLEGEYGGVVRAQAA